MLQCSIGQKEAFCPILKISRGPFAAFRLLPDQQVSATMPTAQKGTLSRELNNSSPGTADGEPKVLVVAGVLVAVTGALEPGVVTADLGGGPVIGGHGEVPERIIIPRAVRQIGVVRPHDHIQFGQGRQIPVRVPVDVQTVAIHRRLVRLDPRRSGVRILRRQSCRVRLPVLTGAGRGPAIRQGRIHITASVPVVP